MGAKIRAFFRSLFGSRVSEVLELQLLQLRSDMESRLQDKDRVIENLREEKAALMGKVALYEQSLLPLASRAGADVVRTTRPAQPSFPKFDFSDMPPIQTRWGKVQADHEAQMAAEEAAEQEAKKSRPAVAA